MIADNLDYDFLLTQWINHVIQDFKSLRTAMTNF